jgi:hypothetical protein
VLGFYHWKSRFDLNSKEKLYLQQIQAQTLYIRFFDVDWDESARQAVPVGEVDLVPDSALKQIIPVVFITNRTLYHLTDTSIQSLASKILQKIQKKATQTRFAFQEVQLDCDWSVETKGKFFELCRLVRAALNTQKQQLSATIRLHQIKFSPKTGIPPVDKGVLMLYNVGKLDGSNAPNSILDLEITAQYLKNLETYPLSLDIALPLYSWAVLQRRGQVIDLLNEVNSVDFAPQKFEKTGKNQWKVSENHYFAGVYLYKGDTIRLEEIDEKILQQLAVILDKKLNTKSLRLIFYHLDISVLGKFSPASLLRLKKILANQ